nr:hypothetical protein [Tanacetum cinerariifolium]
MVVVSNIPKLVDKKGGSYSAIAPRQEPRKFNKWKKRMLWYLMGMETYYIHCIKDGLFKLKIAKGDNKHDKIESVISYEIAKDTWIDLVYSFKGPSNTKENRIMDLKLKYYTFKEKSSKSLLQTYTYSKTLLNELANDGVTLSKHEINVGFVNVSLRSGSAFLRDTEMQITLRPLTLPIFMGGFSRNSNDEADERSCDEYFRDLEL